MEDSRGGPGVRPGLEMERLIEGRERGRERGRDGVLGRRT
jgi:hypothetical protein